MIGVIGVACYFSGMSLQFWSFRQRLTVYLNCPRSSLPAAPACGSLKGCSFPGTLPRRDSLARAGSPKRYNCCSEPFRF